MLNHDRDAATAFAAQIDSLRQLHHIPGLAVAILRDTTVLLVRGFGYADVARGVPVTPDTPFDIASVTKPISAVVALRLAEDGVLDLDQPMRSFRGFQAFCEEVRAEGGIFWDDYACQDERLTLHHLLSMTANGVPGERFYYNPPSFSWASRPMAEMSGMEFSSLVDTLVFAPAQMHRSARIHRRLPLRPDLAADLAHPYHTDASGQTVVSGPPPPQGDGAAGGVIATIQDLARFDIALVQDRLISRESREFMWTPTRGASGGTLPYGLGWFVADYQDRRLVWHTGVWEGRYSALYLKVPAERLTLILLANSDGLRWESNLSEAAIERSAFARAFLAAFEQ